MEPHNVDVCSEACADDYIGMKRGAVDELDDEDGKKKEKMDLMEKYPYLLPLLALIRMSGKYNMMMPSSTQGIYTSLVCLCGFYGQSDHVSFLMSLRGREFGEKVYNRYLESSADEINRAYEWIRALAPYGKTFIDTYLEPDVLIVGELDRNVEKIIAYINRHTGDSGDIEWAQAIVGIAEEKCLQKAIFARDVVELASLRGVYDQDTLKITGAQLL